MNKKICVSSQLAIDPKPVALPAAVRREVYRSWTVPETFLNQRKTITPCQGKPKLSPHVVYLIVSNEGAPIRVIVGAVSVFQSFLECSLLAQISPDTKTI